MKTHVEGCEFHPVVFQVFDRETEIRVEGAYHFLQADTARERERSQNVLDVKQAELLRICVAIEGWAVLYTLATSDYMTQERAAMGQCEDIGWDSVDGIGVGHYMSTLPNLRRESRTCRLGLYFCTCEVHRPICTTYKIHIRCQ